jgi:hypothetical protein
METKLEWGERFPNVLVAFSPKDGDRYILYEDHLDKRWKLSLGGETVDVGTETDGKAMAERVEKRRR